MKFVAIGIPTRGNQVKGKYSMAYKFSVKTPLQIAMGLFEQSQMLEKLLFNVPIYPYHPDLAPADIEFYLTIARNLRRGPGRCTNSIS